MKPLRIWLARVDRAIRQDGSPWHLLDFPESPWGDLHRLASQRAFFTKLGAVSWLSKLLLALTWPVRLVFQAGLQFRRFGATTAQSCGRAKYLQWLDMTVLGLGYGLPPFTYYRYQLFLPENRAHLADYLYDHEIQAIFSYLNCYRVDQAVENKHLFSKRCAEGGIACVPTIVWEEYGCLQTALETWPTGDLICKPLSGCRGEGVMLWRQSGTGYHLSSGEKIFQRNELTAYLSRHFAGRSWLLQPALTNHPSIADLSLATLVTLRIMSVRSGTDQVEVFSAVLKMPIGSQQLSNVGIGSAINLVDGALSRAYPYRSLHPGYDYHPNTGARITGRVLPDWNEALRLVVSAHRYFPDMFSLGWDVALTSTGPVLLETNSGWDVAMPQIAHRQPLGRTILALAARGMNADGV